MSVANEGDMFDGEPFRYSRQDAIRDGYLLDITACAQRRGGLPWHTVITLAFWQRLAGNAKFDANHAAIIDLCYAIAFAEVGLIASELVDDGEFGKTVTFEFKRESTKLKVKLIVDPGDDGKLVATVMLPDES